MHCKIFYKTYYGFNKKEAKEKNRFETTRQKRAHFEVSIYMYSMSIEYKKKVNFFLALEINHSILFIGKTSELLTIEN